MSTPVPSGRLGNTGLSYFGLAQQPTDNAVNLAATFSLEATLSGDLLNIRESVKSTFSIDPTLVASARALMRLNSTFMLDMLLAAAAQTFQRLGVTFSFELSFRERNYNLSSATIVKNHPTATIIPNMPAAYITNLRKDGSYITDQQFRQHSAEFPNVKI